MPEQETVMTFQQNIFESVEITGHWEFSLWLDHLGYPLKTGQIQDLAVTVEKRPLDTLWLRYFLNWQTEIIV